MPLQVNQIHNFTGHLDAVYDICPGVEPHLFYSAGADGLLVQWDMRRHDDGQLVLRANTAIYCLHFFWLNDLPLLAVGQSDGHLHIINLLNNTLYYSQLEHQQGIFDIYFDIKQQALWTVSAYGSIKVLQLPSAKVTWEQKEATSLRCLLEINSNTLLVSGGNGGIYSLDKITKDLHLIYSPDSENTSKSKSVFKLFYNSQTNHLLSVGRNARINIHKLISAPNIVVLQTLDSIAAHYFTINDIVKSPNGLFYATGAMDKTIKIWDTETLKLLKVIDKARNNAHTSSVNTLLWTSFGLLSASDDRRIILWSIENT